MHTHSTVIRPADHSSFWLLTDHVTPLLRGGRADGGVDVCLSRIQPGGGPPPHLHANEDEMFYVLDGEITFFCRDRLITATAGSLVFAPRGVPHCFKCTSDAAATMLIFVPSSNFLAFAETLAVPATDASQVPAVTPELIGKLMTLAPQFGITMMLDHALPALIEPAPAASGRLWVMGEHVSLLATKDQTDGHFTVVEIETAPAGGPPPHAHTAEDEIIYVITGRHEFLIGETTTVAGPGDLVYVPRGTRHRYSNLDALPGRLLSVHTPGGFESFFNEVGIDAAQHATAPQMVPPPQDVLVALLARHGMTA